MNKYQKELIAKCVEYPEGTPFDYLYIIPSGKMYNGYWGKNGYNDIYLVAESISDSLDESKYYFIGKGVDIVTLGDWRNKFKKEYFKFDIPEKLNCIRLYNVGTTMTIKESDLSCITIDTVIEETVNED